MPDTPNRLAHEASPYLRQHANNPVDWYPWGEEALARARAEDKPILLSIGYSACHWCHVMAHESFENPSIARRMNAHFVNIKVDREERPDLDQLYQSVLHLMGLAGGWPLTLFLMPDLRPFYGGTYFPATPRYGMPAFPRLLETLVDAWEHRRGEVEESAAGLAHALGRLAPEAPSTHPELEAEDLVSSARGVLSRVDPRSGGFHGAPKFPHPMDFAALLRAWRRSGERKLLEAVLTTLEKMAAGGIHDQLGGGFHRYSVDAHWQVPHFEKMLYDNAQLLHLYSEAYQVSPLPLWRTVAEGIAAWLEREMRDPGGAFYASLDADSEGEEGRFYVWRPEELDAVLSPSLVSLAKRHYGVDALGNFEGGATVLHVASDAVRLAQEQDRDEDDVRAELEEVRAQLLAARSERIRPGRDDKILAGWNGLAIRGLAFAGRVFRRPDWGALAIAAADHVLAALWKDGRLARSHPKGHRRVEGLLEDYGDLASGLVALYQATFEERYLEAAAEIATEARARFWDQEREAYLAAPRDTGDLVQPVYTYEDNAWPSGASTLTEAQIALAALTGENAFLEQAERYLQRMRPLMVSEPWAFGHLWLAADAWLEGAAEVVIAGEPWAASELLQILSDTYAPSVAVSLKEPGARVHPLLVKSHEGREPIEGHPTAYLCRRFACERPVTEASLLRAKLAPPAPG